MVKKAAMETKCVAGPSSMNTNSWRRLLTSTRNTEVVTDLRTAIAKLARKLCTEKCEHEEPITARHLILAKKNPDGIRSIGVGEIVRRVIGRCIMKLIENDVMKAAGNLQLCAGQQSMQ